MMRKFFEKIKSPKDKKTPVVEVKSPKQQQAEIKAPDDERKKPPVTKPAPTSHEIDFDVINPTVPIMLEAQLGQLRSFLAGTARFSRPVLIANKYLVKEKETGDLETYPVLFDVEEQQEGSPSLVVEFKQEFRDVVNAFRVFYETALQAGEESENVRPLSRMAVGKGFCAALKGTKLHILYTPDDSEWHMKSFELSDYKASDLNNVRYARYGTPLIKIFPNQKFVAIGTEAEVYKTQKQIFIVDLETGKTFSMWDSRLKEMDLSRLKEMDLNRFDIIDDSHILASYTQKSGQTVFAVWQLDFVNDSHTMSILKCQNPPGHKLSEMINLANGLFVTLRTDAEGSSGVKRLDVWELKGGDVSLLSSHAAKAVFRLESGEGYFVDCTGGVFRAKMIDPVQKLVIDLEVLPAHPLRQCVVFPHAVAAIYHNTMRLVSEGERVDLHVVPDCAARAKIAARVASEFDDVLDKLANFRSTLRNMIKEYLGAAYECTLFRSPHWPVDSFMALQAAKISNGELVKLDDDYIAQLRALLTVSLPVLRLPDIKAAPDLKRAIELQIKKVDGFKKHLDEEGRWVIMDMGVEFDAEKIMKAREELPATIALKNVKALFQKLLEEVTAGRNPTEAMRELFEKQVMDKTERLVYFKTYMEFFKLDELVKRANELMPMPGERQTRRLG